MILIELRSETYRYSIYNLTKAFFGDEEVSVEIVSDHDSEAVISIYCESGMQQAACIDKISGKNELERELYKELSAFTGKALPWGMLTGVRPVKLAMKEVSRIFREHPEVFEGGAGEGVLKEAGADLLLDGKTRFAEDILKERFVSRKKAELSWDIAVKEKRIIRSVLNRQDRSYDSFSLYIGIPVCPSICSYCSFSSGPLSVWKDRMDDYVSSLCTELKLACERVCGMELTSVYIGGGTPTVLTLPQMERLLTAVGTYFLSGSGRNVEYTLEAGRADTITRDKLIAAKEYGVNRISVNPQTMQQKTLDLVGRKHTVQDTVERYNMARELGFDNINMDLIAGLPGEDLTDMEDTLSKVISLEPDSLTVHALAIKRAAKMNSQQVAESEVEKMIEAAAKAADEAGLSPYYLYRQKSIAGNFENVGYAKSGFECIYNIMIMEEVQHIIACGAGASGKILLKEPVPNPDRGSSVMTEILHTENPKDINEYIRKFKSYLDNDSVHGL